MAVNKKLDRRHDINAGERLPERLSRVLDDASYRDNIEAVQLNEADEAFRKAREEKREAEAKALARKKAFCSPGVVVALRWTGIQFVRVEDVNATSVKVGPCWYGFECIEIPSQALLNLLQEEMGAI